MADKNDLTQFFNELSSAVGAKTRSPTKIEAAISKLIKANSNYAKASPAKKTLDSIKAKQNLPDPTISGIKFSELARILGDEKVVIPKTHNSKTDEQYETNLLEFLMNNYTTLIDGVRSNLDSESAEGFIYSQIGLKLMQYNLVKFDKLPAAQAKEFKRLTLSLEGNKFIAHLHRLMNGIV